MNRKASKTPCNRSLQHNSRKDSKVRNLAQIYYPTFRDNSFPEILPRSANQNSLKTLVKTPKTLKTLQTAMEQQKKHDISNILKGMPLERNEFLYEKDDLEEEKQDIWNETEQKLLKMEPKRPKNSSEMLKELTNLRLRLPKRRGIILNDVKFGDHMLNTHKSQNIRCFWNFFKEYRAKKSQKDNASELWQFCSDKIGSLNADSVVFSGLAPKFEEVRSQNAEKIKQDLISVSFLRG